MEDALHRFGYRRVILYDLAALCRGLVILRGVAFELLHSKTFHELFCFRF